MVDDDAIALINSKYLSNFQDNKIMELGAYNDRNGIRYQIQTR